MNSNKVSIVITTKNRKKELGKCLNSCLSLQSIYEILVFDDGSDDGTFEFVKTGFPSVSLFRSEHSLGLINARTKCASLVKGDIIVSIDDDCIFQDADTIADVIPYFDFDKVAAITIPVVDVLKSDRISQKGKGSINDLYICSQYRGCAHAVRKDIFLSLGGYYDNLVRQEEETEFALRLYNNGYVIRIANCKKPILHYHSNNRSHSIISFYRARNKFIIKYKYSPLLLLPFDLLNQVISLTRYELKNKQIRACLSGFKDAFKEIVSDKIDRTPMKLSKYLFYKKLRFGNVLQTNNS